MREDEPESFMLVLAILQKRLEGAPKSMTGVHLYADFLRIMIKDRLL